jgi:hypothetical protein
MSRIALVILSILLLCPRPAGAEPETILQGGIDSGFFGAPVVKFSEVEQEFAVLAGLRGGWIINHSLSLGLGGYGLSNNVQLEGLSGPDKRDIEFGYGGVEIEYINSSDDLLHFTIYTLIGAGGIGLPNIEPDEAEAVFVFEPMFNLVINVSAALRIETGGGYRWVSDTNSPYYSNEGMSAFTAGFSFLFGKF